MSLEYRQQIAFLGMLIGAMMGAIGALVWLDYVADPELSETNAKALGVGDMARIATATVALVRQIHDLATDDEDGV